MACQLAKTLCGSPATSCRDFAAQDHTTLPHAAASPCCTIDLHLHVLQRHHTTGHVHLAAVVAAAHLGDGVTPPKTPPSASFTTILMMASHAVHRSSQRHLIIVLSASHCRRGSIALPSPPSGITPQPPVRAASHRRRPPCRGRRRSAGHHCAISCRGRRRRSAGHHHAPSCRGRRRRSAHHHIVLPHAAATS